MQCHSKNCLAITHTKSVLLPEKGGHINFQSVKSSTKVPLIIYDDFKYVLMPSTNNIDFGPNTEQYQDHVFAVMTPNWYVLKNDIVNHTRCHWRIL